MCLYGNGSHGLFFSFTRSLLNVILIVCIINLQLFVILQVVTRVASDNNSIEIQWDMLCKRDDVLGIIITVPERNINLRRCEPKYHVVLFTVEVHAHSKQIQ